MTEVEKLKIEAANLFFAADEMQVNLMQINKRLTELKNTILQLEKEKQNGDPKED